MPLSEVAATPRKTIFVGGPGRSGTSFVADRLGRHPDICSLPDVELKLFTERNGLLDLYHVLVQTFSPNRATVAMDQFRRFYLALVDGRFGQPALSSLAPREHWLNALDRFAARLTTDGQPVPASPDQFRAAARSFLWHIGDIAARRLPGGQEPMIFLEKTPHALLEMPFLTEIAPRSQFVHVMRDPRSIAFSLRGMKWGPDDLGACCTWVASYCEVWLKAQAAAAQYDLPLLELKIEAISAAPDEWSDATCRSLQVTPVKTMFRGADPQTLNRWALQCSEAERDLLQTRLAGWARHFGYCASEIGSASTASTLVDA